jgi:hypothetical protein
VQNDAWLSPAFLCAGPVMSLFRFEPKFLNPELADELFAVCVSMLPEGGDPVAIYEEGKIRSYQYRGKHLVRSPKVEFALSEGVAPYRFGQERVEYDRVLVGFPPTIQRVAAMLNDTEINHAIIICYQHGTQQHIPWHHDKQEGLGGAGSKDIVAGSSIYNVVVCDRPRIFQLAYPEDIEKRDDGHGDARVYQFNEPLPHGSMIALTANGNRLLKHRVPKEKGWVGMRFSIVFRTMREE